VLGVAAFQVLGIALQGKFFAYHFAATLALLGLLAGWGIWKLWLRVHGRPLAALAVLVAAALVHDLHPEKPFRGGLSFWQRSRLRLEVLRGEAPETLVDRLHSAWDVNAVANRRVAEWIARRTQPSDTVFVWGFEPGIYHLAGRRPASRYIYNAPQRLAWPGRAGARAELVEEMERTPPAFIVVVHGDVLALVTGNLTDSAGELPGFPALARLLRERYRRVARIEDFEIFARAAAEPGAP
jgi:hypothetical protein